MRHLHFFFVVVVVVAFRVVLRACSFSDQIYEDNIRKNRGNVGNWIKYAVWEESQGEIER